MTMLVVHQYYVLLSIVLLLAPGLLAAQDKALQPRDHEQWAKEIARFEAADQQKMPPKQAILFAGSSSMVYWDTKKSFPQLATINRGFGGSHLSDSVYFAKRIITRYEPRIVLVYAGDNDLAQGVSPQQINRDFQKLVKLIHDPLPATRVFFIAIKPSTKRWSLFEKQRETNALIATFCKTDSRLRYVDVVTPMLNAEGKPRQELLRDDGLHLNERGYELWTTLLKPMME